MKTEAMKKVIEISDNEFEKAISKGVVLVDFWAAWCAPCRMQGPILEELTQDTGENVVIAKVNVDYNRDSASRYNVMSIPTLILFKDGKPVNQFVGVQSKDTLLKHINNL